MVLMRWHQLLTVYSRVPINPKFMIILCLGIDRLSFVKFGNFDSLGVEVLVLARWGKGKKWDFLRILGGFVPKGSIMS